VRSLAVAVIVVMVGGFAAAQTSLVNGSLQGLVVDTTGGRIPDARVTVRDVTTQAVREAYSAHDGAFRFPELPPGTYEVLVKQAGFAPYRHTGVAVPLGSTVQLDIALQSAQVSSLVTVTAQPPALDPQQTSLSSAVDTERIEELPVESRDYLNFALLAPGVASSAQQPGRQALAPLPDSGFTFGGLRGRSNYIAIDGLDNNDEYTGSSRTELSLETVQEFQVVSGGLSAESGGASGGSIDVITRNGANDIHGDAFLFVQNGSLNARNPFETESVPPELHRYRAGLALGGPIVRNRTFYYAAFEQEHNRALDDAFFGPGVAAAVNRALAGGLFSALPTHHVSTDLFPTSRAETEASAKINHQLTRRNAVMLRYAFTQNQEAGDAFDTEGWNDSSARGSAFTRDSSFAGSLTTVIDAHSVGDLRFQAADRRAVVRTGDAEGPGVDIVGLLDFGRPYEGNGRRTEGHRQATYTYSREAGSHLWKAGVTLNRVGENADEADGFGGLYLFGSLADFMLGQPYQYRQAFGNPSTAYTVANYGGFVQDHWSFSQALTIDLGLRYDFEQLPSGIHESAHNFSPRIGLAYHLAPKWVLRAGYGIFYDRYVLSALNRLLQKNGTQSFEEVLGGAAAVAEFQALSGGALPAPLAGIPPSIYTADGALATPYSQQVSGAVEHLLARDLTLTASYLFVRGLRLPRTRNTNLLPPAPPFGPGRLIPGFDDIYQLEDSAHSAYQGGTIALNRRMSNELEFSASYTLSKTRDDASDFNEQPQNPLDLAQEWELSRQDQRHRVVFNALWELPIGDEDSPGQARKRTLAERVFMHLELAPIFTVESGRPVDPLTGIDNGSDAFPLSARPFGFARNSFRGPALTNVDLRLLKYFPFGKTAHLDLVAEAFNLLNHANAVEVNPVFGAGVVAMPGFLQPLAGSGARRIEFSLDFEF